MKKIEWQDSYSVGVKEIDEQHKMFISILNDLFEVFYSADRQHQEIASILDQAFNYVKFHFATEERYFFEFKYEDAEAHTAEHSAFGERLKEVRDKFEKENIDPTIELMDHFEDWFVGHINIVDKKYTKCFHDNGLF